MKYKIVRSDTEWKELLGKETYSILRGKSTEPPFTGKYDEFFEAGKYICAGCGLELFISDSKFNSGCGWPAFDKPTEKSAIEYVMDKTFGMSRVEILCSACGGHLGHVFNDGPSETGERYCVNSASLNFVKEEKK